MARETYKNINFTAESLRLIETINGIIENYQAQGSPSGRSTTSWSPAGSSRTPSAATSASPGW